MSGVTLRHLIALSFTECQLLFHNLFTAVTYEAGDVLLIFSTLLSLEIQSQGTEMSTLWENLFFSITF